MFLYSETIYPNRLPWSSEKYSRAFVMMGQAFNIRSSKVEKELDFIPPMRMAEGMKKMKDEQLSL